MSGFDSPEVSQCVKWDEFIGDPRHAPYYGVAGCAFFVLAFFLDSGANKLSYGAGVLFGFAFAYQVLTLAALMLEGGQRTVFQMASVVLFFIAISRFIGIDLATISVQYFFEWMLALDGLVGFAVGIGFLA